MTELSHNFHQNPDLLRKQGRTAIGIRQGQNGARPVAAARTPDASIGSGIRTLSGVCAEYACSCIGDAQIIELGKDKSLELYRCRRHLKTSASFPFPKTGRGFGNSPPTM
jgi:hypothetical protein